MALRSIAGPGFVRNTIVAEEPEGFANVLERAAGFGAALNRFIRDTFHDHKRITFNRNSDSPE